jgi:hypothetical protein
LLVDINLPADKLLTLVLLGGLLLWHVYPTSMLYSETNARLCVARIRLLKNKKNMQASS